MEGCIICPLYRINRIHLEAFLKQHNKCVNGDKLYAHSLLYCVQKENFEVWQLGSTLTFEYTLSIPEQFIENSQSLFCKELDEMDNSFMLVVKNLFIDSTQCKG